VSPCASRAQAQVFLEGWRLSSRLLLRDYSLLYDCSPASLVRAHSRWLPQHHTTPYTVQAASWQPNQLPAGLRQI
jgi:hypothetical protein